MRVDPLTGLRTIIAGERAGRPNAGFHVSEPEPIDRERDPFAEGHEDRTPPEIDAVRPDGGGPDAPGWRVRVVPNLYPALSLPDGDEPTAQDDPQGVGHADQLVEVG